MRFRVNGISCKTSGSGRRRVITPGVIVCATAFVSAFIATPSYPQIHMIPGEIPPLDQPASRPTARMPVMPEVVAAMIVQLGDDNPAIREAATVNLMDLHRRDLAVLRGEAEAQMPLMPEQIVRLHEIVMQVYLADERYVGGGQGFLGLSWSWMGE